MLRTPCQGCERALEAGGCLLGDGPDGLAPDDAQGCHGVQRLDDGLAVLLAQDDVARQQGTDRWIRLDRPVGERRVAGAEDEIGRPLDPEFRRIVAWTSISVITPNPSALSAASTRGRTPATDPPTMIANV